MTSSSTTVRKNALRASAAITVLAVVALVTLSWGLGGCVKYDSNRERLERESLVLRPAQQAQRTTSATPMSMPN